MADSVKQPRIVNRRGLTRLAGEGAPPQSASAFLASGVFHVVAACVIMAIALTTDGCWPALHSPMNNEIVVRADAPSNEKFNFANQDQGLDPSRQTNYNVDRIEQVSVPGPLRPDEPVGIKDASTSVPQTISPPPGIGSGAGGGSDTNQPGLGGLFGDQGGFMGGRLIPGQIFGGRSGATRERMLIEGGGNKESEAAVAKGLEWLKKQQKPDGHWAMVEGSLQDDFGATGLGLLPFLGAGITQRLDSTQPGSAEYHRNVDLALRYLISKQQGNGLMGGQSKHYSHAICTMALCEAYAMTQDQSLRRPAQKALDYLIKAQHSEGGFRYEMNEPGDTSVTGWCLQALDSGRHAGLTVPPETLYKIGRFLDSVQSKQGAAYGYLNPGEDNNMTAVGLLCRNFLGWDGKNPAMNAGVEILKKTLPRKNRGEIYFYYYATQVMHFCASEDDWKKLWNPRMRDHLIDTQDNSTGPNRGSWAPDRSTFTGSSGGRLCTTSLSLLTLEVYYRKLPSYKREFGGMKDAE